MKKIIYLLMMIICVNLAFALVPFPDSGYYNESEVIAIYHFNESTDDDAIDGTGRFNGTSNAPTNRSDWFDGLNNSYDSNGVNGRFDIFQDVLGTSTNVSVCAYVNFHTNGQNYVTLFNGFRIGFFGDKITTYDGSFRDCSANTWRDQDIHVCWTYGLTTFSCYVNGSFEGTTTTGLNLAGRQFEQIGTAGGNFMDGIIDDLVIFNFTLSAENVSEIFAGTFPTLADTTPPEFNVTNINDSYNDTFNIDVFLNMTLSETGNCTTNNTAFDFYDGNDTYTNLQETTLSDGFHHIEVRCNDTSGNINNKTVYFSKDTVNPVITMITPLADNTTTITNYGNMTINLTLNDTNTLYSFEINITDALGIHKWNDTQNLSTATYLYQYENINTTTFNNETFTINMELCDSHTSRLITPAEDIRIKSGEINYTFSDTKINLRTEYANTVFTTQKISDRYIFNTVGRLNEPNIFYLSSNKNIDYLKNSPYKGHFVIGKYWLDFEPYNVKVTKYNDYYRIEVLTTDKDLTFNSIGELNCITEHVKFTLEEATEVNLYNINIISDTNWFNNTIFDPTTIAGVFVYIFLFLILVAMVVLSEYTEVPALLSFTSLLGIFYGMLIFATISAIFGSFVVIMSVVYLFTIGRIL